MPVKKKSIKKPQKQTMVDFGTAITRFWSKYTDFDGVAQRSEFWFWWLFNFLVTSCLQLLVIIDPVVEGVFLIAWFIATFVPWLALYSRRFHDAGFSAKLLWLPLAVMFGIAIVFFLFGLLYASIEIMGATSLLLLLSAFGYFVFMIVVCLLPSKLKNNPYRK